MTCTKSQQYCASPHVNSRDSMCGKELRVTDAKAPNGLLVQVWCTLVHTSEKFVSSSQLVTLGVMKISMIFVQYGDIYTAKGANSRSGSISPS
jgi:hypothetical protein